MTLHKKSFVFVTPVWGYIETFLNLCLPTLLASGNLPALSLPCVYQIHTTLEGKILISAHPLFQELERIMPVEFYILGNTNSIDTISNYSIVNQCHQNAIYYADERNAALFFIMPDCLFPQNAIKTAEDLFLAGVRVISVPYLRLNLEDMSNILLNSYNNEGHIELKAQDFMRLALNNLHDITKTHLWEEEPGFMLPHILLWKVGQEGLLGRFFYGMPLMVYPRIKYVTLYATVDIDYPYHACPNMEEHYLCQDSNEIVMLELTSKERGCTGFPKASLEHLLYYSEYLNEYQLEHGRHTFKMHCGIKNPHQWEQVQKNMNTIMDIVYAKYNRQPLSTHNTTA